MSNPTQKITNLNDIIKLTQSDLQGQLQPSLRENPEEWKTALEQLASVEDKKVEHFKKKLDPTALYVQKTLSDKRKSQIHKKLKEVEPILEQKRNTNVVRILQSIANSLERIAGTMDPDTRRSKKLNK